MCGLINYQPASQGTLVPGTDFTQAMQFKFSHKNKAQGATTMNTALAPCRLIYHSVRGVARTASGVVMIGFIG